jgi:hypothetical protein
MLKVGKISNTQILIEYRGMVHYPPPKKELQIKCNPDQNNSSYRTRKKETKNFRTQKTKKVKTNANPRRQFRRRNRPGSIL